MLCRTIDTIVGHCVLNSVNRREVGRMVRASYAAILMMVLLAASAAAANPADSLKVVKQAWKKGARNTIGIADITIRNDNAFGVKDIKLRCVFTTKSTGKVTEIQQTIAGPLKAKAEQTFK